MEIYKINFSTKLEKHKKKINSKLFFNPSEGLTRTSSLSMAR